MHPVLPPGLRRACQRATGPKRGRRIVLHLGPHKTASTFIQRMAEFNLPRLPLSCEVIAREAAELQALRRITMKLRSEDAARAAHAELTEAAAVLGVRGRYARATLISHEDLLGPMPSRAGIMGLYPFAHLTLPAMLEGLQTEGAEVQVALYRRPIHDWLTSVQRYRNRHRPDAPWLDVRDFAARHAIPYYWQGFYKRLETVLPQGALHVLEFRAERDAGLVGAGLYRLMGMDARRIARLVHIPPQNVTRPETARPAGDPAQPQQ
ncbi:hypothetical protein DDZ14_03490 [Maritimibacter sp. 55A14]|nr:hypothetical protein DDZ14_03490 [Maritimibacter sp. 55A14]